MPEQLRPELKQVTVKWPDASLLPLVSLVNVFTLQATQDGVIVTLGEVAPPMLTGTPEEQQEALRQVEALEARPVFRFVLTPARVQELMAALGQAWVIMLQTGQLNQGGPAQGPLPWGSDGGAVQ